MQPSPPQRDPVLPSDREYLLARRQAILLELGAIERRLGLPRSVVPKHERERATMAQEQHAQGGA
jgi:hypothetical protein